MVSQVILAMGIELAHQRISKAGKLPKDLAVACRGGFIYGVADGSSAQLASLSLALPPLHTMLRTTLAIAIAAFFFVQNKARAPVLGRFSSGFGGTSTKASGADPESLTSTCYRRYGCKKPTGPMRKAKTCPVSRKANARLCFVCSGHGKTLGLLVAQHVERKVEASRMLVVHSQRGGLRN